MTPAPLAPAPHSKRRGFPLRQPRPGQLSLLGLLHAAETHPDLPEVLRPVLLGARKAVSEYRAIDADAIDVSPVETLALESGCAEGV
jgi:hypothetical protein